MRICVFGAGAIGGHLAARLAKGGAEVSLVARGPHLAAIQARGLILHARDETLHSHPAASADPATLGVQDVVLVTVKAPSLPSVAATIAPLLGPQTPVVFVGNGLPWWYFDKHNGKLGGTVLEELDPGQALRRAVGPARTIGGVINAASAVSEPGVVEAETPSPSLILGELDGEISARARAIAAPLLAGGFKSVEITPHVRRTIWEKLARNLPANPASILAQAAPEQIFGDPAIAAALRSAVVEVAAIAAALGEEIKTDADKHLADLRRLKHHPSLLQDLLAGRPMEIAPIFDAPLTLARMLDVPTPTLDLMAALVRARARAGGLY